MQIKLQGSVTVVVDYFEVAMAMILYQRNIYPQEMFVMVKKYGINVLKVEDPSLTKYMNSVLMKVKEWIEVGNFKKLVIALINEHSGETVEKWEFGVDMVDNLQENIQEREICKTIQSIIKQIIGSCTLLPLLEGRFTFHVLAHTKDGVAIPHQWIQSDNHEINDGEFVNLRSFSTLNHTIQTNVEYKNK